MNIKSIKIGNKKIGENYPVFIVAEISGNHNQNFNKAKELVKTACESGADAIKLQTYTPDTMTINSSKKWFKIKVNKAWKGNTLFELYQKAHTPWDWHIELKKIANSYKIPLFSTPFDETSVDFLEKINVPAYKIASFELIDIELLKKVAQTKKPVIISRGMSSLKELNIAISTLRKYGSSEIVILHCVSSYPSKPEEMNLLTIKDIKKRFNVLSGLSDHTLTNSVAVASVALGAKVVEKHFTLRRLDGGPDANFSLEPKEFRDMVSSIRDVEKAIGKVSYSCGKKESENIIFRRSLFIVEDIKKGEKFTKENIRSIRPGYGLSPLFLEKIIDKKAKINIKKGTPLNWNLIDL